MLYQEAINGLKSSLEVKRDKDAGLKFKTCVSDLKNRFGQDISTKFLRDLMSDSLTQRQQTKRINYLMRRAGLKTERAYRNYSTDYIQSLKKDVVVYENTDGLIYSGFPRGLFNEEMTANEEALNRRNAINKGGGVRVKEIKRISTAQENKSFSNEVLFMISI